MSKKTSKYERDKAAKKVWRETKDKRASVSAYVAGNKWATENARGVGNL